jgi:hypothetical protein
VSKVPLDLPALLVLLVLPVRLVRLVQTAQLPWSKPAIYPARNAMLIPA